MDPLFLLAGFGDMEPAEDDDDVPSQGMAVDPLFSMAGFDFAPPTGGPQPTRPQLSREQSDELHRRTIKYL